MLHFPVKHISVTIILAAMRINKMMRILERKKKVKYEKKMFVANFNMLLIMLLTIAFVVESKLIYV